jgi:hypothetical protein
MRRGAPPILHDGGLEHLGAHPRLLAFLCHALGLASSHLRI